MSSLTFRVAGGDGASAPFPRRRRLRIPYVWRRGLTDYDGRIVELTVAVTTRRHWEQPGWREGVAWVIHAGPVVVAIWHRPVGVDDPKWRETIDRMLDARRARRMADPLGREIQAYLDEHGIRC